jgi:hypothetical protein
MSWTSISYLDIFILNCVLANGWAGIHTVDVINAAANGVDFDNTKTHSFGMEKRDFGLENLIVDFETLLQRRDVWSSWDGLLLPRRLN